MDYKDWTTKVGADGLSFVDRLDSLIATSGKKQGQIAREAGVPASALSEYKRDPARGQVRIPGSDVILKLAKYFGVSTDYLYGLTPTKSTNADIQAVCNYTGLSEAFVTYTNYYVRHRNAFGNATLETINAFLDPAFLRPLISIFELLPEMVDDLRVETDKTEKYIAEVLSKYPLYEGDAHNYEKADCNDNDDDMCWCTLPDEMDSARDKLLLTKLDLIDRFSAWMENRYKLQDVVSACRAADDICRHLRSGEPPEDLK